MGEVEAVPEEAARSVFEVNFLGAANVTKEAVRFFRDVNTPPGGRLLQVSSAGGNSSKFALEGLSECLSTELDPAWNIKVTIIEPGGDSAPRSFTENMKIAAQLSGVRRPNVSKFADPRILRPRVGCC
ncbi:hypothetical protein BU15DRAFT_70679 [Melanogaster broomeanus]|nr:hypothetical protein BU15DRAFT_70679 [Melanogaster broomeanus]